MNGLVTGISLVVLVVSVGSFGSAWTSWSGVSAAGPCVAKQGTSGPEIYLACNYPTYYTQLNGDQTRINYSAIVAVLSFFGLLAGLAMGGGETVFRQTVSGWVFEEA